MRPFRTILEPIDPGFHVGYADRVLCMGSCFAEHIGRRLADHKFQTCLNPFGILYNPLSLARGLELLLEKDHLDQQDLFEHQGLWHSFDFHGRFSLPDKNKALSAMQGSLEAARTYLEECTCLILTLGTAFVFEHREREHVVANCHRLPGSLFRRRMLSVEETTASLEGVLGALRTRLPDIKIILSVSPVRHLRDGLVANQRSKAVLLLAAAALQAKCSRLAYYPAYELLLDDLRDYRFYEEDHLHPSKEAVDYIWEHFLSSFLPENDRRLLSRVEKLRRAANHRPFHPGSKEHQAFLRSQLALVEELAAAWPQLDWETERKGFLEQLLE